VKVSLVNSVVAVSSNVHVNSLTSFLSENVVGNAADCDIVCLKGFGGL